jgi:orotidine-5'-phosphate decarboxylase
MLAKIDEMSNPSVIGLDPRYSQIPNFISQSHIYHYGSTMQAVAYSYLDFNRSILDLVSPILGFVKFQMAFYEQAGYQGIWALEQSVQYAKEKGMMVIVDGKRNDIGSTAHAYAKAYLDSKPFEDIEEEGVEVDALTLNPYLGQDSIEPFLDTEHALFILTKTSNPSSHQIQNHECQGVPLYCRVADCIQEWGKEYIGERGYSSVGAVVAATYPEEAKILRKRIPNSIFLVPGYGFQGAKAQDVKWCFNDDGYGALIHSSRALIHPYTTKDISKGEFEQQITEAACIMKYAIQSLHDF